LCISLIAPGDALAEVRRKSCATTVGAQEVAHQGDAPGRKALEVRHDFIAEHEAIRVLLVVRMAGKLDTPVRRDQAEAVPPPPPGLSHLALLQHDVRDASLHELPTDREPGLTGTDNDNLDSVCHRRSESMFKQLSFMASTLTSA
jgi:hypothetical protein